MLCLHAVLVFFASSIFASDYEYDVSDYGDSGVNGEIEANKGEKDEDPARSNIGGRIRGLDTRSRYLGMGQLSMKILMVAGLDTKNQP